MIKLFAVFLNVYLSLQKHQFVISHEFLLAVGLKIQLQNQIFERF